MTRKPKTTEPPAITLVAKPMTVKATWHIASGDTQNPKTLCGLSWLPGYRVEQGIDARAERHANRPVCTNCRGQLLVGEQTGWMANYPKHLVETMAASDEGDPIGKIEAQLELERRDQQSTSRKETRMARTTPKTETAGRKKAASEDLLDPAVYADQPLERLQRERLTINNRLSGLGTQIKRHTASGDQAKLAKAEARRDELVANRGQLAEAIAAKATTVDATTQALAEAAKPAVAKAPAKRPARAKTATKTPAAKRRTAAK